MKKKGKKEKVTYIFIRYVILFLLGIFLPFYKILLPLTIWPTYFLLDILYDVSVSGNMLSIGGLEIELIEACIASSAYYLLLILNLTISMKLRQRIYSLLFSFFSLLVLNVLRIFIFSLLYVENFAFFDITHKLFWYVLSTLFVVGAWFLTAGIFKIKAVPVYSDIKRAYLTLKHEKRK